MSENKSRQQSSMMKNNLQKVYHRQVSSDSSDNFNQFFEELLKSKDKKINMLESPSLSYKLAEMKCQTTEIKNRLHSAAPNSISRVSKNMERMKYTTIKNKICKAVNEMKKNASLNLQEVLNYRQVVLSSFLQEFAEQISKECRQKGDILKYIWNSMFSLISHISESLSKDIFRNEKKSLQNVIQSHKAYQSIIEKNQEKQKCMVNQSQLEKATINSLVYSLRLKRKEVERLYKTQKVLLNKANQMKKQNQNLQMSYIDLMSSVKDMPAQSVEMLLKAREEINKNRHYKIGIQGNKKQNIAKIHRELKVNADPEGLKDLLDELRDIASNDLGNPHLANTLLQAAIQNFGLKADDSGKKAHNKLIELNRPLNFIDAQTQIAYQDFVSGIKSNEMTQVTYVDKSDTNMIANKTTQTAEAKKKLFSDAHIQADFQETRKEQNQLKLKIQRSYSNSFLCRNPQKSTASQQTNIKKKHLSEINLMHKSSFRKTFAESELNPTQQINIYEDNDSQLGEIQEEWNEPAKLKPKRKGKRGANSSFGLMQTMFNRKSVEKPIGGRGNSKLATNKKESFAIETIEEEPIKPLNENGNYQTKSKRMPSTMVYTAPISPKNQLKRGNSRDSKAQQSKNSLLSVSRNISTAKTSVFRRQAILKNSFLEAGNVFNIEINQQKEQFISNNFKKKKSELEDFQFQEMNIPVLNGQRKAIEEEDHQSEKQNEPKSLHAQKYSRHNSVASRNSVKFDDQNDYIVNICRSKDSKLNKKNKRDLKERLSIYKYKDEFTSVKDNITVIAKDVKDLVKEKSVTLKKSINANNLKNHYKLLMMSFSKAYDCYNKGVLINSLVYPLYQSFALVYGAINNTQIYKKMIAFIAGLCVNRENTILRFFLFLLGLDQQSPYSQKVTISEVYLCLKLLQKIAIDGKVTLNIESIYTDVDKVKEQLVFILQQENIPSVLRVNVQNRVIQEIQSSKLKSKEDSYKINIYNIVTLIIQEVIKCKTNLKESFNPIFEACPSYLQTKKLPIQLLEMIFSLWKSIELNPKKIRSLLSILKKGVHKDTITIQQFCSLLFESNVINFDQLYQRYIKKLKLSMNWKIPAEFNKKIKSQVKEPNINSQTFFQYNLFLKLQLNKGLTGNIDLKNTMQRMQKIIFLKFYDKCIQKMCDGIIGSHLSTFYAINTGEHDI